MCLLPAVNARAQATESFLGMQIQKAPHSGLWEGPTDYSTNLKPTGVVKAVMLFALFPDTVIKEVPRDIYNRLVPESQAFLGRVSGGQMQLKVDTVDQWFPMNHPTTWPGYDCSGFKTQKAYLAEVISKAAGQVDFHKYDVVYVVGSLGTGLPNSPTFIASPGDGIKVNGAEVRLGVTFGRDCRGANWGWQTLCHETGHIFGLPDLYLFGVPAKPYKNIHASVGFWDLMGFQAVGSPYLAWQQRKLTWLKDKDFAVIARGTKPITVWIRPILSSDRKGYAAAAIPISDSEAIACEVRQRDPVDTNPADTGLLVYRVSLKAESGHGPITILPAAADDLVPAQERKFITLYNALYTAAATIELKQEGVTISILGRREDGAIQIRVAH